LHLVPQHETGSLGPGSIARSQTATSSRRAAAAIVCLLVLLTLPHRAFATDAGQVLTYNGDCYVIADGKRTKLSMGDAVHAGDVVEIADDAKLKLQMADGSVLSLGANSRMTIGSYDVSADGAQRDVKLNLDSGVVRAVVSKMTEKSTFEVSTATGVAAARSTDWFVEYVPTTSSTEVSVLDGTVAFSDAGVSAGSGTVLIPPKFGSDIVGKRQPTAAQPRSPADFAWLTYRTDVRLGLCECMGKPMVTVKASCVDNVDICKTDCAGAPYSFVPNARETCIRMIPGTAVRPAPPQ
jgi:hypothetical protein